MHKLVLGIEYDGSAYCGWQRQSHSPSVQAELEQALTDAFAMKDQLVFIDVVIDPGENVYPMIEAGKFWTLRGNPAILSGKKLNKDKPSPMLAVLV